MPGLFDLFRPQAQSQSWMTPEMQRQQQQQSLMGLAQGFLQAGAPSRMPVGFGQALGMGLQGMQGAQDNYMDRAYKQQAMQMQMQRLSQGPEDTSDIRNYKYWAALAPEDQKRFLEVKRLPQWLNAGNQFVSPGLDGAALATIPKGLPPQESPALKGEQERQKAIGDAAGKAEGTMAKKIVQAPVIEDLLTQAEALLPDATSGGLATVGRDVAAFFNTPTDGSQADSQLDVIAAALTSSVPRMEGPQSNFDVKLYEKAAGDLANSKLPDKTRLAAIKTIRTINNKYAGTNTDTPSAQAPARRVRWEDLPE